ncbi:MAG: type II toxin-antitoxin system YoeB family toxin [Clostridiales bacterium]|nr:type II toxin-antitoxin system YoeB family toxin [Clostridiales bacterium]
MLKILWHEDAWQDYSVRIDEKNRIVFRICDDHVEVFECGSHYGKD